jgi:hypothetical protein
MTYFFSETPDTEVEDDIVVEEDDDVVENDDEDVDEDDEDDDVPADPPTEEG